MTVYLPNVAHARKELARLTEVETDLRRKVIALRDRRNPEANETWAREFTYRLRHNVRPAIAECLKYLAKHA